MSHLIRAANLQGAEDREVNVRHDEAHQEDGKDDEPILSSEVVDLRRCAEDRHAANV